MIINLYGIDFTIIGSGLGPVGPRFAATLHGYFALGKTPEEAARRCALKLANDER